MKETFCRFVFKADVGIRVENVADLEHNILLVIFW